MFEHNAEFSVEVLKYDDELQLCKSLSELLLFYFTIWKS